MNKGVRAQAKRCLDECQIGQRVRVLYLSQVETAYDLFREWTRFCRQYGLINPYGILDGGAVANRYKGRAMTTLVNFDLDDNKNIKFAINRGTARHVPYGCGATIILGGHLADGAESCLVPKFHGQRLNNYYRVYLRV